MKRMDAFGYKFFVVAAVTFLLLISSIDASEKKDHVTKPVLNNGKKWRVGYYEGGTYSDYQSHLKAAIKGLMGLGWMEKAEFPSLPEIDDTKALWKWFSGNAKSRYIEFVGDAYWSSNWDKQKRSQNKNSCIERLNRGISILCFPWGPGPGWIWPITTIPSPRSACPSATPSKRK